jgi:N-acetylglucosamine malate deacetylase 1
MRKKVLIVAAHADDEAFGMGGTLLKFSKDTNVDLFWLIATWPWEPKWNANQIQEREKAILGVQAKIGFEKIVRWDYQDNLLDNTPINELQEKFIDLVNELKPNQIFTPSMWDFNFEHNIMFDLVEMSTKPYYSDFIEEIFAYEIPSSTEASFMKGFQPNVYFDITDCIDEKLELVSLYSTEIYNFPHPRSTEYAKSLAMVRGAESGVHFAESFKLLRGIRK